VNRRQLECADVTQLVKLYEEAARARGKELAKGNIRIANRRSSDVADIYRELRRRGPTCQEALLPLLMHDDPHVRGWAAAHALEFSPAEGESVLAGLAEDSGELGFEARMTLELWRKGELRFP
jgi:hypothetical protein